MGIRSKFFIVVGPIMIMTALLIFYVISNRFLDQFLLIESELAEQNVDRAVDAFAGILEDVNVQLSDWAQWDDTYVFIQDRNEAYVNSNLNSKETSQNMNVHFVVIVDRSGDVAVSRNFYDDGSLDDVPQGILNQVFNDNFINYDDGLPFHKGIIQSDGKVLLAASRPILQSDGTGPAMGTIIFMRVADDNLLNELSGRVHLPLSLYRSVETLPLNDQQKDVLLDKQEEGTDDVITIEGDAVAGYGRVHDILETHMFFVRIEMPRTIYSHSQSAIHFLNVFLGVACVVFTIVLMLLLEWLVFSPLSRLGANVDRIRSSNDDALRIQVEGNDQISHLGTTINQMIDSLHNMRQQKEESENRFRTVADLAPVMIWMAGVDKKCNYFNKGWLDFTGRELEEEIGDGWSEGVHPDDIERCIRVYYEAFDEKRSFRMEYRLMRADGQYRWILDNGIPNFAPDGTFVGYLGSCIDITDRKISEEKNNERVAEMEMLNKIMVSRELKMIELKKEIQRLKLYQL